MPSDFTYDAGPNVATKSNLVGLPAGADASKYLAASDVNILSGAAGSLRDAIIQGRYHGLTSTPDAPVSVAGGVSLRANDGDLEISLDGSDYESLFGIIIGDSASKVDGHGNGAVNRVALWSDANTVSSDSGLTYASGVLFSKNSLGTDALKLQQSAVHEATRFSLLQPGGGPTDYRLTVGVRDNFVGTPQDASLFFQSDGTYPFKFFMGDTNVFSVDQDGIGKVAGYLGVNGMTGDSTFPLNVGGAVIANNVANGSSYGLTMSNGVDSTWTVIPVGSGQVRMKNDSGGRWMSIADGDGSVDAFAVRGGHVIIGDATCADDGVHALQVTGSGIFTSTLAASNLSGTNSGDITVGTFGSSPTANGATLSGQALTLQPADATHPGSMTPSAQTFAGDKTFSGALISSVASGSDAIEIVEGARLSLNGATGTSYLRGDATSHGVVMKSAAANSGTNYAYTLDTANALSASTGLLALSNNGTSKVTISNSGQSEWNDFMEVYAAPGVFGSMNNWQALYGNKTTAYNASPLPAAGIVFATLTNHNGLSSFSGLGGITCEKANNTDFDCKSLIAFHLNKTATSSPSEVARLTTNGALLINTTTDDGSSKLQVAGAATFSGALKSSVASGSDAMEIVEGAKISLNGSSGTSYIKGDASTHGVALRSNVTDGSSNPSYLFDSNALTASPFFRMTQNGNLIAALNKDGDLGVRVLNLAAGYIDCVDQTGNAVSLGMTFQSRVADSSSAVGFILTAGAGLSTAGAKIASFRSVSTEKAFIDKDGGIGLGGDSSLAAGKKLVLDGPSGTRYLAYNSGTSEVEMVSLNGFNVTGVIKGQQTLQIGASTASYMDFVGGDATKFTLTAHGGTDTGISLVTQGVGAVSVTEGTKYSLNGTTATSYIKGDASTHGLEISSNVTNSSSNYAFNFLAPNGTALNAQVFRFRFGSTTFFEQQNDGSLIVGDGTHAPYIASRNTVLTLAGTANDGATAKGVILNCQNLFTTSGAKIVSVTNSNTEVHAIDLYGKEIHTNVSGKARSGVATLSGGTVTVTTASVKTASKIRLTHQGTGTVANFGIPYVGTITNSTSFVINSTNALDDDVILWEIIEVA